jgi:hypothetical protein
MIIHFEEIAEIIQTLHKLNSTPFDEIVWMRNGKPMDIPEYIREEFKFIGLANFNFIKDGFYLGLPKKARKCPVSVPKKKKQTDGVVLQFKPKETI